MVVYDAIVVGLGGAGSSAAYHLSAGGMKVLGLEQFGPVHPHGSSHGRTRIYRTVYHEGAKYVPLVQRAQKLWYELQEATGESIIQKTGGLTIGRPDSPSVSGAIRSATACSLRHEVVSPEAIKERFPQFYLRPDEVAVWDPDAGALFPETCIQGHSSRAVDKGAELHYGEAVRTWSATNDSVEVRTNTGRYRAKTLALTAGAWTRALTEELGLPLEVERQFVLWFSALDPAFVRPDRMPVFIWDRGFEAQTYGLPDFGDGVKVGSWSGKVAPTPEAADRVLREEDALPVRDFVSKSLGGLVPRERDWMSCLFTNSPDHDFLIGKHPKHPNVVVVSACSGHGFKFASVVGELVRHLLLGEDVGYEISSFDVSRFRNLRPPSSETR